MDDDERHELRATSILLQEYLSLLKILKGIGLRAGQEGRRHNQRLPSRARRLPRCRREMQAIPGEGHLPRRSPYLGCLQGQTFGVAARSGDVPVCFESMARPVVRYGAKRRLRPRRNLLSACSCRSRAPARTGPKTPFL